jgi:ribose transport system permease protein
MSAETGTPSNPAGRAESAHQPGRELDMPVTARAARALAARGAAPLTALASLIVLFVVGGFVIQGFTSQRSIDAVLILSSFLGIAGVGETLVILLGGIDLSIPFVMDMSNVLSAQLNQDGWPFLLAALAAVALGGAIGAVNGFLSSRLSVHPLIVTLGVGYIAQGAVEMWTNGAPSGVAPAWLGSMTAEGSHILGVQLAPVVLVWVAVVVLVVAVERRTVLGRRIYATGNNPLAARYAGVSTLGVWTATFAVSGVFSALGGIALLGFAGGTLATAGDPYLFLAVGAVVVGGTSLAGGRGGYGGTVIGALMLTVLSTILVGVGFSASVQQLLVGVIIIVVVATFGREAHVRDRV